MCVCVCVCVKIALRWALVEHFTFLFSYMSHVIHTDCNSNTFRAYFCGSWWSLAWIRRCGPQLMPIVKRVAVREQVTWHQTALFSTQKLFRCQIRPEDLFCATIIIVHIQEDIATQPNHFARQPFKQMNHTPSQNSLNRLPVCFWQEQ